MRYKDPRYSAHLGHFTPVKQAKLEKGEPKNPPEMLKPPADIVDSPRGGRHPDRGGPDVNSC